MPRFSQQQQPQNEHRHQHSHQPEVIQDRLHRGLSLHLAVQQRNRRRRIGSLATGYGLLATGYPPFNWPFDWYDRSTSSRQASSQQANSGRAIENWAWFKNRSPGVTEARRAGENLAVGVSPRSAGPKPAEARRAERSRPQTGSPSFAPSGLHFGRPFRGLTPPAKLFRPFGPAADRPWPICTHDTPVLPLFEPCRYSLLRLSVPTAAV